MKDLLAGGGKIDDISLLHMSIQNLVGVIETTNERIEKTNDKIEKTNDKVDKLTEVVSGQAVLFEKLANIEQNHAQAMKHVHARITENKEDIEKIKDTMHTGCPSVKNIDEKREIALEQIKEDKAVVKDELKSLKTAIKELQDKPAKRWDGMITTLITVLITSTITAVMIKLGLKQ